VAIRALARSFLPSKARRQAGLLLFLALGALAKWGRLIPRTTSHTNQLLQSAIQDHLLPLLEVRIEL
jgi:hypothetical protein